MADRSLETLAGIITALKADATVAGLVGARVYDRIPAAAPAPYIQVTEDAAEAWDGVDFDGWDVVVRIDVWSRKRHTSAEALTIGAAVQAALHNRQIPLATGQVILARLLPGGARTIRDDDGETVNREMRFRFQVQG